MQPQAAPPRTDSFLHTAPHALWQGLPPTLRRRAFAQATGWLAPRPTPQTGPIAPGIAIVGEFSRASGLGESARLMAAAARRMGLPVWTIDLPPPIDARPEVTRPEVARPEVARPEVARPEAALAAASSAPPPGVPLVLHVNAPMLPLALLRLPAAIVRNRPIIGYWAWEMSRVPLDWRPALACVSQVWVPSHFTAAALEPLLPGRVRVVPPPLAIVPPVASTLDRAAFGLPPDAVVVLVSFNLASSFARKNPFAAIAAFREAFGDRPDRILVLKVSHPDHAPADLERLVQMAHTPNIRLETRTLPPDDRHALTACADIVLSLHRGEGFGLVLAEAMLLGKPVIATAWSGNIDFMSHTNAALVGYRLVPARDDRSVYRGQWAEPDVAEAAAHLRMLADNPAERKRLGAHASASTLAKLDGRALTAALGGLT